MRPPNCATLGQADALPRDALPAAVTALVSGRGRPTGGHWAESGQGVGGWAFGVDGVWAGHTVPGHRTWGGRRPGNRHKWSDDRN